MKRALTGVLAAVFAVVASVSSAQEVIWEEDFDDMELGPNVMEGLGGGKVWTNEPPEGWSIESELPANGGVIEWAGWAFADAEWWTNAAGNQERAQFTIDGLAENIVAVADPDEYDDAGDPFANDPAQQYDTYLSTPPIPLNLAGPESIIIKFDSSWRPEDTQNANLTVSFDGGREIEVLTMFSVGASTDYEEPENNIKESFPDLTQVNETLEIAVENPASADEMVVTWACSMPRTTGGGPSTTSKS